MEGLRLASTADPKGFPPSSPPAMRGNHVGVHVRSNDTSAAQFLVMRGPHGCHLFASLAWPRQTRCSLEVIDFPTGGFSPPEGCSARGFKPPAFSRFLFQSAVESAETF